MGKEMLKTIYKDDNKKNALEMINELQFTQGEVKAEDCPWVQIGSIYSSVTVTGEESWKPLVRTLHQRGRKAFTVFTGRHGSIFNLVDKHNVSHGISEREHYNQDVVRMEEITKELNVTVELIDTSGWHKDHTKTLKNQTQAKLKQSKGVIYAWCHSIFSFCEVKFEKIDEDLAAIITDVPRNSYGQMKSPSKWGNPDYDKQLKAYNEAKKLVAKIEKRAEGLDKKYANIPIFRIVGQHWRWAPRK